MIVCKFGGSATARAGAIENIKRLARDKNRRIFIFSAIGKERKNDVKFTDLLISLTKENSDKKIIINKIKRKFDKFLIKINKKLKINEKIDNFIKKYNKNKDFNYLISRGEYLTAYLMSKYINIPFVPAEKIIYFKNGKINYKKIKIKLNYYLNKFEQFVVPGFYGINEKGKVHLLSRGGSDVSGAILARVVKNCIYENWTDESGIKEVNPLFLKSKTIFKMGYAQLKVMTGLDAKIIHEDCADILKGHGVILQVGNILKPNSEKTIVSDDGGECFFVSYKENGEEAEIFYPDGESKVKKEDLKAEIVKIYNNKGR